MPKGAYSFDGTPKVAYRADTSFRACTISLLIFAVFCITIGLILWLVPRKSSRDEKEEVLAMGLSGDESSDSPDRLKGAPEHNATSERIPSATEEHRSTFSTEPTDTTEHRKTSVRNATPQPLPDPAGDEVLRDSSDRDLPTAPLTSPPPPKPVPCETAECKDLAASILHTMGHEAKPCQHFYEYACGGVRRNKYLVEPDYAEEASLRISGHLSDVNNSSPESFKKFKALEQSCRIYNPLKHKNDWKNAVLEEMNDIGSISTEESLFSPNFNKLFEGLLRHDSPLIFEITLDVNDKDTNKFAVKIFPSEVTNDPEESEITECQAQAVKKHNDLSLIYDETLSCVKSGESRRKLKESAITALKDLGILSSSADADKVNEILKDYEEFLDINIEVPESRVSMRLELQERKPDWKTVEEMNAIFSGLKVDWASLLQSILDRPMKDGERVQLYSEWYFIKITEKFKSRGRQLHNGLLVAFAAARRRALGSVWLQAQQPMDCTRAAMQLLPDVASALYLRAFPATLRSLLEQAAADLLYEVIDQYTEMIQGASSLRDHRNIRGDLIDKMSRIKLRNTTDTPELLNTDKLDLALREYEISETDFAKNAIHLMARNRKVLYKRIDQNPANCIWTHFISPYDTEGLSIYSLNVIAIPLGAAQKPFFHPDYLPHLRMAGLGFMVAREVAHHVDSLGIHFDTTLTEEELIQYDNILPTVKYNDFSNDIQVEYLNETSSKKYAYLRFKYPEKQNALKRNNLISDMIGIKLAFKAFNETDKKAKAPRMMPFLSATNDQTFFIYLAQKFCTKQSFFSAVLDFFESYTFPPELRVKLMMENSDFNRAFNCSKKPDIFRYTDKEEVSDPDLGA